MAGRAGRLGLWDIGYVGFIDTPYESRIYSTKKLYNILLQKPLEPEEIIVAPSYKRIVKKLSFKDLIDNTDKVKEVVEEEIEIISKLSSKQISEREKIDLQTDIMIELEEFVDTILENGVEDAERIYSIFQDIYFDEFSLYVNSIIAEKIYYNNYQIDCMRIYNHVSEKYSQREQLQFLKFFKGLSKTEKYRVIGLKEFEEMTP
jgi:hypothetical protein